MSSESNNISNQQTKKTISDEHVLVALEKLGQGCSGGVDRMEGDSSKEEKAEHQAEDLGNGHPENRQCFMRDIWVNKRSVMVFMVEEVGEVEDNVRTVAVKRRLKFSYSSSRCVYHLGTFQIRKQK